MKNLGRIFIILSIFTSLFAGGVKATLDRSSISVGEFATLNLTITGTDIKKPKIDKICDSEILSTSTQTSIRMINSNYTKSYILSYKFQPQHSCKIKPIDVEVDGVVYKTNVLELKVAPFKKSKNDKFDLTIKADKKEVYVGESFNVEVTLKQKINAEVLDSKFIEPSFKGFWIKGKSSPKQYQQADEYITKIVYTIAPQRVGKLEIKPAQIQIATRASNMDMWGSFITDVKWRSYFSNSLTIDSKALPNGVDLIGNFTISLDVDKTHIKENEAVNLVVKVEGNGNLEDIGSFKPKIDGVTIFDEEPKISGNKLTQKIAIVADSNFTIPQFSLLFFNPKTKLVQRVSTKEVKIVVDSKKKKSIEVVQTKTTSTNQNSTTTKVVSKEVDKLYVAIFTILGFIAGVLFMMFKPFKLLKKEKELSIKDNRVLLIKLMPYKDDKEVAKLIESLEANLFLNKNIQIDKKVLKEIIKKYDLK